MLNSLRERALRRINFTFPERQIYIRSDGRVQFFTFSTKLQATLAGICILFFGWVAFTSVNVIFKDRILAAKEQHFTQMQLSYESRIADLQLAYDELNSAVVMAQDRFKAIADSFEAKQQILTALIERKKTLQASLGIGTQARNEARNIPPALRPSLGGRYGSPYGIGGAFDAIGSAQAPVPPYAASAAKAAVPAPEESSGKHEFVQRRAAEQPTFLKGAVRTLENLFQRKAAAATSDHPLLQDASDQSARIVRLELEQPGLVAEAAQDLDKETARLTRVLRATGIDSKTLMKRVSAVQAGGGPLLSMDAEPGADTGFSVSMAEASSAMGKLESVVSALNAIPLAAPIDEGYVSSGFGSRIDPFNERLAYHSGIDLSGRWGSDVRTTAAGVVVFAGRNGAYGNSVEVDHGFGIRTRYGHLSKILVQAGTSLDKGSVIGRLGSTGRSTGPHVHYEVWYDKAVRDPNRFIKAGQNVLKN